MKAAVIHQYGDSSQLEVSDIAVPAIKADEVLVENMATSINPIDYKARQGLLQGMFQWQFPVVLGWDIAGRIIAVGDDVHDFHVGDAIFARPDIDPIGKNGTYAEYTAVKADKLARKPDNISFEAAAAVPLAGLTALQMLRQLQVKAGQKVLIQAGAGGVGIYAIQLAKNLGAYVATTASHSNRDFVTSLGADRVIDYHQETIAEVLSDYDAVFDMVGDIDNGIAILKPGGHFVTISATLTEAQKQTANKTVSEGWLETNGQDLAILADAITDGTLEIVVDSVYPLTTDGIRAAHERSETHHARGKIVVKVKVTELEGE
ncbi:Bifunctional protein: zinc-containing alcohol dehydrogenase; quinone oxidoreductase (NADPH:quinone reductase); Similar to arginate lyase [Leuconostoc gelidum subsp. gasicomitatum]|uniref:Bifunctional protein: zinc-containing alcohol dehydrogenase quinone oxidoreductase ( NADPH:quinone reductase) Similar to arginate lyase n=1 Tax=Leuconostoc gasicomitatum TaxID=115778 RepID=A0ABP2BDY8_9LACO|nr:MULTISPECIES: NADP-dependent oxidoreductase [Leuconostoc gelidum group]MBZ5944101.1 NADP-dependent oxidoreductase [Leuconostoc gasicomitatum]MBZ5946189.1 NADP-dependent oxidoreductase [Leuconostoc gasicomitatum]MBZ5949602.1 NADP-dependent oxidoreductase [Leuconostoc gasicomitatum]MBZ5950657.1 NADP-dependent oxidoreductase [Leuconostoc gasicomitatum]MBZ5968461.1 NADP-dependent oxidoreductase [Leuconostoc gasicomitatum]